MWLWNVPILPKCIYYVQFLVFNSSVPYQAVIGPRTIFAYGGIGVVLHARAKVGADCIIGQGVTIGGRSRAFEVPEIGDRVYLGAGSRILGAIRIGNDVVVGANAVVISDIPDGCVAAGVPARVIKRGISMRDFV